MTDGANLCYERRCQGEIEVLCLVSFIISMVYHYASRLAVMILYQPQTDEGSLL